MPSLPRSQRVLKADERFVARPTKIVPSIVKLLKNNDKLVKETVRSSHVNKPISAFKSVPAPSNESVDTPVYIPR